MTDQQRSAFRFRVPRLRPSVPPPRTTQTTTRNPPVRPSSQPSTIQTQPTPPTMSTTVPALLPKPLVEPSPSPSPPTPTPTMSVESESLKTKPPSSPPPPTPTPPVKSIDSVPVPPPEPPVEPSPPPPSHPKDEPASMAPTPSPSPPQPKDEPASRAPTPSPSHPHVSTKPSSPLLHPTSQPSSPHHVHPSQPPEVNSSTETSSSNHQSSSSSTDQSNSEENHEPITTPMISHQNDKSPKTHNPNIPQPPDYEKPTNTNPNPNEKPAIITLAGDNKGTSMHIGSGAAKREKSIHINRRYKLNHDETSDATTDEDGKENESKANENEEQSSYINCNIQGINNSLVFNCSITEKSPGVHFGSCNKKHAKKLKRKYIKSTELNKVKVNSTPSQKHTIRRRCLRGLFAESSDSDPQKPRRHGCRYVSGNNSNKDDKMDVA